MDQNQIERNLRASFALIRKDIEAIRQMQVQQWREFNALTQSLKGREAVKSDIKDQLDYLKSTAVTKDKLDLYNQDVQDNRTGLFELSSKVMTRDEISKARARMLAQIERIKKKLKKKDRLKREVKQVKQLKKKIDELQDTIVPPNDYYKEISRIKNSIKNLRLEIDEVTSTSLSVDQIKDAVSEEKSIEQLSKSTLETKKRIKEVEDKISDLLKDLSATQAELERVSKATISSGEVDSKIKDVKAKLEGKHAEAVKKLSGQISEVKDDMLTEAFLTPKLKGHDKRLKEHSKAIKRIEKRMTPLPRINSKISAVDEHAKAIAAINDRIAEVNNLFEDMINKITRVQHTYAEKALLNRQIGLVGYRIKMLKGRLNEMEEAIEIQRTPQKDAKNKRLSEYTGERRGLLAAVRDLFSEEEAKPQKKAAKRLSKKKRVKKKKK